MTDEQREGFEESLDESLLMTAARGEVTKLVHANVVTRRVIWILSSLLALAIAGCIILAFAVIGSYHHFEGQYQQAQASSQAQGREIIGKLCNSFGQIAALQPPAGSAGSNPSRGYEQKLHQILSGVYIDIECPGGHQ